jgi:ligand-binding SRPBCC domain-containing protein
MAEFVYRSHMPVSADALWDWHARPGALERLTPPWDRVRVESRTGGLEDGARVTLSVPVGPRRVIRVIATACVAAAFSTSRSKARLRAGRTPM